VLTSQGISFLHAGTEFLRSKKGVENSFNAGDSINTINWKDKALNADVFQYVQSLIKMRKSHPAFRMTKASEIEDLIRFDEKAGNGIVSYTIDGSKLGDEWKSIQVILNGSSNPVDQSITGASWNVFSNNNRVLKTGATVSNQIRVNPFSMAILYKK
jgi:pullulanase